MAGTGKQKYIAGLRDLVGGFTLMEQRRHMRMLENLEKAKFEYEKQLRNAQLAEEEAYHQGVIGVRSQENQRKVAEAGEKRRAGLMEGIQRGRVMKNLEAGDIKRAERIAFNRGIALDEGTKKTFSSDAVSDLTPFKLWLRDNPNGTYEEYIRAGWRPYKETGGGGGGSGSPALDKARDLRAATIGLSQDIAAEKPRAINLDKLVSANRSLTPLSPEPAPAERFLPEASRYTGASDLPMKAPEIDPYEAMSEEEWDNVAWAAIQDAVGRDPVAEKEAMESPHLQTITFAAPSQRRRMLMDIPRLFGRPVQ